MTNIEKQFFETFGIEPKYKDACRQADKYWNNEQLVNEYGTFDKYMAKHCAEGILGACTSECQYSYDKAIYPSITDRVLLELICVLNDFEGINVEATTIKGLKEELLKQCIEPFQFPIAYEEHHEIDKLYKQVRALFREAGE